MDTVVPLVVSALLDPVLYLAGHGDSITGNPAPDGNPSTDDAGIGMASIVAVLVIAVGAITLLVWLQRQEREQRGEDASARGARSRRLKSIAPAGLIAAIIATPLIVWTASSGGDKETLTIDRWTNADTGKPELLISLTKADLNTLQTTGGKRTIRIECIGRQGQAVLAARQEWPLIKEPGYEYPHAHQAASQEQVQLADRCRLRGTRMKLEGEVEGALSG